MWCCQPQGREEPTTGGAERHRNIPPGPIRPAANLKGVTKRFQQAMRLMRRHDPQAREDGFHLLLPHAAEHTDELIAEFSQERHDHGLRCWLLELIGQARSPAHQR
jgi:hypothetical protein